MANGKFFMQIFPRDMKGQTKKTKLVKVLEQV
jgi:hypothetical protein